MSIRTLSDEHDEMAVMYDSVTGVAFGPVFNSLDEGGVGASDVVDRFLDWLNEDPRKMLPPDVVIEFGNFIDEIKRDGWDAVVR